MSDDRARFRCNACGKVVVRELGWKHWTPSFCTATGRKARLYRVSAPEQTKPNRNDPRTTN